MDPITTILFSRIESSGERLTSGGVGNPGSENTSDANEGRFVRTERIGSRFTKGKFDGVGNANKLPMREDSRDPKNDRRGFRSTSGWFNVVGEGKAVILNGSPFPMSDWSSPKLITGGGDIVEATGDPDIAEGRFPATKEMMGFKFSSGPAELVSVIDGNELLLITEENIGLILI